jgi:hypothetical protein
MHATVAPCGELGLEVHSLFGEVKPAERIGGGLETLLYGGRRL